MGTRADFYVGRGVDAEWIGSIGWDGYPDGLDDAVLDAKSPEHFRAAVTLMASKRDDFTAPEKGWPWPWNDSRTTDYAYAFDDGQVWASNFGREWFPAREDDAEEERPKTAIFPDMAAVKNTAFDNRSGAIFVTF